ncbi:hypothetical protein Tco_1534233, partial [Tanacetum coccineum]
EEQEAAYTMKALKESKKNNRRQPSTGGSSEGTGTIPGVPNESTVWGSEQESEYSEEDQSDDEKKNNKDGDADDEGDDHISDTQDTNDEDDETESDEDEIYKYKIRVRKDMEVEIAEPKTVENENKEKDVMTDATKPDVEKSAEDKGDAENVENAADSNYQVKESTEFPLPSFSLSVLSRFEADKVPVSVIPKTTNLPPILEILTETPASTTISPPQVTPIISILQQTKRPIPTPPIITESPTITIVVPKSDALIVVQLRVTKLEKDVFELKKIDLSAEALATLKSQVPNVFDGYLGSKLGDALQKTLQKHSAYLIQKHYVKPAPESSKIQTPTVNLEQGSEKSASEILKIKREQAEKQKMSKYTIKSTDKVALKEYDQKSALYQTMHENKSFNRNPANHKLYHALMEALIEDENAMDKGVADTMKDHKRKHDDDEDDDDEDPPARLRHFAFS